MHSIGSTLVTSSSTKEGISGIGVNWVGRCRRSKGQQRRRTLSWLYTCMVGKTTRAIFAVTMLKSFIACLSILRKRRVIAAFLVFMSGGEENRSRGATACFPINPFLISFRERFSSSRTSFLCIAEKRQQPALPAYR